MHSRQARSAGAVKQFVSFVSRLNGKGQLRVIDNGHHADLAAVFIDKDDPATPILTEWLERIAVEHPTP